MSASFGMESTFRGPLAPGYFDIVNMTLNNLEATARASLERRMCLARAESSRNKDSRPLYNGATVTRTVLV
jgi:hypothetical protein